MSEEKNELNDHGSDKELQLKQVNKKEEVSRVRQRRIAIYFISSLTYLSLSLVIYSLADNSLPEKFLPFLFNDSGNFEIQRLIAFLSAIIALVSFTLGYFSLLSSARLSGSALDMARSASRLAAEVTLGGFVASAKTSRRDEAEDVDGQRSTHGQYSVVDFPLTENGSWQEPIISAAVRLQVEQDRLATRSSNTLIWGIVVSTVAVGVLLWIILTQNQPVPTNFLEFWFYYGPRVTLVIIVGLVASFFLRLHVASEKDISRVRNEITNLELRLASGLMASENDDLSFVSSVLGLEERNFIISKQEHSTRPREAFLARLAERITDKLGA